MTVLQQCNKDCELLTAVHKSVQLVQYCPTRLKVLWRRQSYSIPVIAINTQLIVWLWYVKAAFVQSYRHTSGAKGQVCNPKSSLLTQRIRKAHLWTKSCQDRRIALPSADSVPQPIVNIRCYLIIATKYIQNLRPSHILFHSGELYKFKGSQIQFLWQKRLVVRQIGGTDGDLGRMTYQTRQAELQETV